MAKNKTQVHTGFDILISLTWHKGTITWLENNIACIPAYRKKRFFITTNSLAILILLENSTSPNNKTLIDHLMFMQPYSLKKIINRTREGS